MPCDRCGDCCKHFEYRLSGDPEKTKGFVEFVTFTRPRMFTAIPGGLRVTVPCEHLADGNVCRVYDNRPEICRKFLCVRAGGSPEPSPAINSRVKERAVKLTVLERLIVLGCLPGEGNFVTLRILRKLRENLSFTEEEVKAFNIRHEGGNAKWEPSQEPEGGTEIAIGEKAADIIKDCLVKLDRDNQLTEQHCSVYEKFVLNEADKE